MRWGVQTWARRINIVACSLLVQRERAKLPWKPIHPSETREIWPVVVSTFPSSEMNLRFNKYYLCRHEPGSESCHFVYPNFNLPSYQHAWQEFSRPLGAAGLSHCRLEPCAHRSA